MLRNRILFVCHGNTCRSPMAEAVMRDLARKAGREAQIAVASAGTNARRPGAPADPRAVAACAARGIDLGAHRCRQLVAADLGRFDWLVAMDGHNLARLRAMSDRQPTVRRRLLLEFAPHLGLSQVPDPYAGAAATYARTLDLITAGCEGLGAALERQNS